MYAKDWAAKCEGETVDVTLQPMATVLLIATLARRGLCVQMQTTAHRNLGSLLLPAPRLLRSRKAKQSRSCKV